MLRSGKGAKPTEFSECEIQYIGYFTNGKVFENTYRGYEKSVTFEMKKNKVIYGWEIACMSMKKGEKARFKISSA
jgi:FKBP-type peptidyl-prolyl cis-trans isomerase